VVVDVGLYLANWLVSLDGLSQAELKDTLRLTLGTAPTATGATLSHIERSGSFVELANLYIQYTLPAKMLRSGYVAVAYTSRTASYDVVRMNPLWGAVSLRGQDQREQIISQLDATLRRVP